MRAKLTALWTRLRPFLAFRGRAERAEYWTVTLAMMLVSLVGLGLGLPFKRGWLQLVFGYTGFALSLSTFWPTLAVLVRRGHDRKRPAVWSALVWVAAFVSFMLVRPKTDDGPPVMWLVCAVIAAYTLIDYGVLRGTPTTNRFGFSPTAVRARALKA